MAAARVWNRQHDQQVVMAMADWLSAQLE